MRVNYKMRKIGITAIPVFFIFFMLFIAGALEVSAASTIVVNGTCTTGDFYYDTIQEAVSMAKDGDTIIVCPGTYRENIVVDKSVYICSYGGASDTIVQAYDMFKDVFHVTANYVNISGFTIKDGWDGIHLDKVSHCSILNNSVGFNYNRGIYFDSSLNNIIKNNTLNSNRRVGIYLYSSNDNFIEVNIASNGLRGIELVSSLSNIIKNNTLNSNTEVGISLFSSSNNAITNNNASNTGYGIYLDSSLNNIIKNNTVNSNDEDGIGLNSLSNNNMITNNIASNNANGIKLDWSDNNIIKNNTANSNDEDGIGLYSSSNNNTITNNIASNNANGIKLDWSDNNIIKNNTANSNNGDGISLYLSNKNIVEENIVSNNYGGSGCGGIILDLSDNNIIENNIALNNSYNGIYLGYSFNTIIKNNIASNNKYGLYLSSSLNNTIKNNIANLNKEEGIGLYSSSNNNTVEKNIALDNGYGIYLSSSLNNTIKNNIAKSNNKYGICLYSSNNNIVEKNIASNNYGGELYAGIYLRSSFNNSIIENIINSNSKDGIQISSSSRNILKNNIVSRNDYGISLSNSIENNIYHNNIINNANQADDENPWENNWYHSKLLEGNYWYDYNGTDDGSRGRPAGDGIGDTNLPHPSDGYDGYPFVNKSGWLTFLISPEYWDFGTVYQGRSKSATFEIQNRGVHDLTILSISSDPNIIISGIEPSIKIPKDSPKTFNATIDTTNLKGDILRSVEISSDDEITPNKTILIYGFVKPPIHDVRIEAINFDSRVIKGQIDVFNVSISNHGSFDEHNISVELKNGGELLGNVTIPVLLAGETETVSYCWDTKGTASGVHEIAIEVRLPSKELLDSIKVKVNVLPTSEASTLIVTNFDRLSELWGENETDVLEEKLIELSYSPCVNGIIIRVEEDKNCADAYELWTNNLLSPEEANKAARKIKRVIESKLEEYRGIKYIILVGDDRVIPFYRITDNSKESYVGDPKWWRIEKQYVGEKEGDLTGTTTISAALEKNKYLTDDFYADFYPQDVPEGVELYIPDKPIGRLIETPEEIISTIDTFTEKESVYPNKTFITGYDFMNDSSWSCAHILEKLKPPTVMSKGNKSSDTANYNYTSDILNELLKKRNDIITIFQHAEHYWFEIPPGKKEGKYDFYHLTSKEISNSSANLSGAIVYTMSCHSGLNVPPDETNSFDLAQSFLNKKVLAYVSPTGYGMGGIVSVAGHERLLNYFTEYLCKGNDVGTSLISAKQDYYLHNFHFDYIDEKVIASIVLYGLPMYRVKAEAAVEAKALAEDLQMDHEKKEQIGEVEIATLTLRPGKIAKDYLLSSGKPILPKAAWPYTITEKEMIHGITLKSARYEVTEDVPVVIETFTVSTSAPQLPGFETKNWYPSKFFKVNTIGDKQEMVIITGQYRPYYGVYTKGDLREFTELTFDIYISTPEKERDPPEIEVKNESGEYILKASDNESGIFKVIVAYTNTTKDREEKRGEWKIKEYDGGGNSSCKFTFKLDERVEFFVHAVDIYGNVAVDDNGGRYYPEKEGGLGR